MWKSTIGNKVTHKYPNRKKYCGFVEDEVVVLEKPNENYRDLIQVIHWEDGVKSLRFCYYVRRGKGKRERWYFSNHPLSIQPKFLKQLLKEALKKKMI